MGVRGNGIGEDAYVTGRLIGEIIFGGRVRSVDIPGDLSAVRHSHDVFGDVRRVLRWD